MFAGRLMKPIIFALISAILPALLSTDQKAVEYGRAGGQALLLDLYVPDGPRPFPAAILVHGGGFDGGTRATNMAPTFQPLAEAGFAWFSIDYRRTWHGHVEKMLTSSTTRQR